MKLRTSICLIPLILINCLHADLDEDTLSQEKNPQGKTLYPFTFSADANAVGKAKFSDDRFEHQHFYFNLFNADLNAVFSYNDCYKEGVYLDVGYTKILLDWKENPYFVKTQFNDVNLTLGMFSERLCDWHWLAQATIHAQTDHFNLSHYATYDATLWGRYEYRDDINLHLGFLAETGMKMDRFYPIIGFDWTINSTWKINAVFPVNISVVYQYDKCWSLALAGRTFEVRQRVGKNEPLAMGVFSYRNYGAEFAVNYDCDSRITANIHAGYTFGGVLKIADRHYEHKHRLDFDGAPYVGANLYVKF